MAQKIVIIPAYEPSHAFVDYVNSLISYEDIAKVLIVNDGSSERFADVFEQVAQVGKTTVLTHPVNKGKGAALRTAALYCIEHFHDGDTFVTADCDGQHLVKDVLNLAEKAAQTPDAYWLGVRDFSLQNVPERSRVGNRNSIFGLKVLHGIKVTDSQTGLRAFSYKLLPFLSKVKGDRFEYETAALIEANRANIAIREEPIETIYEEKAADVDKRSHFRAGSDTVRVIKVMFASLQGYIVSCVASVATDLGLYWICSRLVLAAAPIGDASKVFLSTALARCGSSVVNFTFNRKFVFKRGSVRSIARYYILWILQMCASAGIVHLFSDVLGLADMGVKPIGDLILALISYQIQLRWVFK